MKKRQRMKNYYDYICGRNRKGCEYCFNVSRPILRSEDGGWVNASISISENKDRFQKRRKMIVNIKNPDTNEVTDRAFIPIKYCFNCGRKLK